MKRTRQRAGFTRLFATFSSWVAKASGRPAAFLLVFVYTIGWAVLGPVFGFSDTWQLVINTTSSIVTFMMVFIIQNTQARDSEAIQAKLDEIVKALRNADNRVIGIEQMTDQEIEAFRVKHGPGRAGKRA